MRWLVVAIALVPALAAGSTEQLSLAKYNFENGRYDEARRIAEGLLERNLLGRNEDLIEANRIAGLCWFYSQDLERSAARRRAERYFYSLLLLDPDYELDPFFTPPAAVQFFDQIRKANEPELAPIRDQRRKARAALEAEAEARRLALARRQGMSVREIQKIDLREAVVTFLPLGAGQFQNGQKTLGFVFASVQGAAAVGALGTWLAYEGERVRGDEFDNDVRARNLRTANWIFLGTFGAAWAASAIHAWATFQPEVVLDVETTPLGAPPATGSLFLAPAPGGAVAGALLEF